MRPFMASRFVEVADFIRERINWTFPCRKCSLCPYRYPSTILTTWCSFLRGKKKKSRLPRKRKGGEGEKKKKRKSATLLFQLSLSVTAYRTRSRIPLAQQREDKGRGLVSKRKRAHNELVSLLWIVQLWKNYCAILRKKIRVKKSVE